MRQFEFHVYPGCGDGVIAEKPIIEVHAFEEKAQARAKAGRLARKANGPVDLAHDGDAPWEDRYITTANPADKRIYATGVRFERLV